MDNYFDKFDGDNPAGGKNYFDRFDDRPAEKSSAIRRGIADPAISLLKGAIGVPEAAVGLADIPTLGYAGKAAEGIGFRPKEAKEELDTWYSPEQQAANRRVQETKGFLPTVQTAVQNPSVIGHTVLESVPSMLGGAVAARGIMGAGAGALSRTAGPVAAPIIAGAAGEGIVGAGQAAEQIRQESPDGLLSPSQAGAALASGAGTGIIGALGGAASRRLGLSDVDTMLAGGAGMAGTKRMPARVLGGMVSEGVLEEMPQSAQEQAWQNVALGKPTMEGVAEQAALGGLAGAAMGGAGGLVPARHASSGPMQKALAAATGANTGSTGTSTGSTGTSTGTSTGAPASDEIGLPVTGVRADASVHDLVQAAAAEDTAQQAPAGVGARQSPSGGTIAPPAPTAPVTSAPSDESRAADAEPPQPNTPAAPEPVSAPVSTAVISPQTSQAEPAGVPPSTTEGVSSNVSQTQEAVSPAPGREAQSAEAADAAEAEREWRDFVANEGRDLGPRRLAVIREQFMARRKMDSGIEEATGRVAAGRQQQAAANRMAILDDLPMTTTGNTVRRFAAALRDAGISDSRVSVDERKLIARRIAARDTLQPLEQEPQNELTVPERTAKQAQPTMPRMDALRRKAALPGVRIVGARMLDRYGRRIATLTTDEAAELSPAGMSPKSVSGTSGMPKGIPKESDAELDSLIAEESRDLGRRRLTLLSLQAISRQKQISAADKAELDALIAAEQQDVAKRRGMLSELQAIARQKISEALDSATKLSQEGNVSADISPDISPGEDLKAARRAKLESLRKKAKDKAAPKNAYEAEAAIQDGNATREITGFMKEERDAQVKAAKVAAWRGQFAGNGAETIASGDISRSDYEKLGDLVYRGKLTAGRAVEMIDSASKAGVLDAKVAADMVKRISAFPAAEAPELAPIQQQAVDAQHIAGKEVEAATPAVVSQAVAKGARNAGKDLRQEQSDLLKQIDEAIKKAPAEYDDATGFVTFDVPGDGKFKVRNNAVRLANFRKNIVAAAAGFRPEPKRAAHKTPMQKIEGGKASPQTIRDMLDDGDLTAALELAKTAGIPVVFSNTPGAAPILLTEAQKFDLPGFKSFDMVSARQSVVGRLWSVVEISTGLWVSTGKTRAAAERLAADRLVKNGPQKFAEAIEQNRDSGKDQATLESEWSKWAEKEENDKDDAAALKQRRDDAKAAALAADRAKWEEFTGEKPDFAPHARNPLDPAYMNPVATLADYEKARKHGKGSEFIDYAESKLDGDIAGHKPVLALLNRLRNNNVGGWSYLGNEGAGGIPRYERTVKTQDGREIRATIDGDVSAYGFVRENDVIKAKIGDVGSPTFRQAREQADQVIDALMAPVTKRAPGVAATPVVERETPVGETQASRVVTPDSLNLLRNPVGNGDTVQFADGSKWVAKEGWTGGTGAWTLLQGRMAHPTVRGVKGQAEFIRAIIDADNASAATQKPASTPEIPEGIPPTVAASVQRALENLREVERILADVEKVRGKGHILAIEVRDQQEAIQSARAKLDKFRGMAKGKGLDADAVIAGMGGEPDLGRFGSPAAADDAGAAKAQTNTEDSGSELTYNRRNRLTRGLKWEDIADKDEALRVKEATKAKVYPKPDYKAMIESGMRQQLAHIVKQVYDSIAAAPRTRAGGAPTDQDIKNYIAGVNRVMDAAIEWSGDADRGGKWLATTVANNSRKFGSIIDVMSMAGAKDTGKSLLSGAFPGGYEPVRGELTAIGGNKVYAALQPSRTELGEAMLAIKAGWPEPQEAWQRQGIKVINGDDVKAETYVGEKGVHVWIKAKDGDTSRSVKSVFIEGATSASSPDVKSFIDKSLAEFSGRFALLDKLRRLVGTHATEDEAKAAARALVSKSASKQTVSDKGISVLAASRTGIDRRMPGEDISSDRLRDTFKFRGINFGNWMKGDTNAKERQLHLNHAYDSFMDLADMLGVPPEAMSLNGMLGVAIGAQGNGGRAAAHFVPGVNEINLTRESGAGSLAHEWGHALDHYFARQSGLTRETDPFLTTHLRTATGSEIRPEILDKFKTIVQAMLKRRMTQQEREAKAKRGIADAVVQIGRWLREPLLDRGLTDDADVAQAVAKIKAGDLGDGTVAVSSRSVVRSAVHDLAMLVKNKSGKKLSVDTMIGVNAQAERVKYLREALSGDADHVPQQMVSTQYAENAKSLDAAKGGRPYWSTSLEMFARAFDAFVSDTLEARAAKNTYLSHAGRSGETVPTGAERTAINASIQGLVDAVETRPGENGNVVLYNVAADEYSGMRDAIEQAIASKKDVRKFRDGGPIDDADSYFDAIGKAISADKVVADRIAEISDDAFAVSAITRDGRMVALTRSARRPGKYQITRFGRDGAPWGDTQHDSKIGAAKEFVGDVDVSTIKVSDGINYNAAAPANITPADSAIYSMAQEGKTAAEILSFIGRTSRRPFNRYLANALRNLGAASAITLDSQGGFGFGNRSYAQKYAAAYNPKTDTVALFTPREAERHVLHELVHAATLKAIAAGGASSMRMRSLFNHVQKSGKLDGQYGMSNLDEFVAEVFSNPKFQQALRDVPAPSGSALRNAWHWFVRLVSRVLGLRTQAMETALDRALTEGASLMLENAGLTGGVDGVRNSQIAAPYHRFTDGGPDTGVGYMLFGEDQERVRHYGKNHYTFDPASLPASAVVYAGSAKFRSELIGALNRHQEILDDYQATAEQLADEANSSDIVDSAGIWDAPEIVNIINAEVLEPNGWRAVETENGAVVFDKSAVKSGDNGQDTRFSSANALPDTITVDGVERPTTNSKGQPIAQDEEGLRNFWRWFAGSEVVDEQGRPLVVYHGTKETFSAFDIDLSEQGVDGIWLTDTGGYASWVASGGPGGKARGNVMDLYLRAENPMTFDVLEEGRRIADQIGEARPESAHGAQEVIAGGMGWDTVVSDMVSEAKAGGHDSLIIESFNDGYLNDSNTTTAYVAFSPRQIKSATGNTGQFSPDNPDIRYNIAADWPTSALPQAKAIRSTVASALRSDANTSWITPFNTQYHKAEKWAAEGKVRFQKVFDIVQQFLGDVSKFAVMAQNEAPTLFHEWRTLGDVKRTLTGGDMLGKQHRADVSAIASPLYEGTLYGGGSPLSGIKWSDAQLRDKFKLSDRQIKLYHEALAAAKVSMDELAKSIVAQHAKRESVAVDDGMSLEDMAASAVASLRDRQDALREEIGRVSQEVRADQAAMAKEDGDSQKAKDLQAKLSNLMRDNNVEIDRINKVAGDIEGVVDKNQKLQAAGYFPLMRFGKHTVTAKDADGKVQFFGMYEGIPLVPRSGQVQANKVADELRAEFPEWTVTTGIKNDEKYKLYKGLNVEAIQLFAEHMDQESLEPFQEFVRLATNNRSAQRRLLHRQGTPGFDKDVRRTLAQFVVSNARATSSNYHTQDMLRAAADAEKDGGDIGSEAIKLVEYVRNPEEEAQALRGFLFFQFLGGSIASAMVNLTQTPMMTLPYLSKFEPAGRLVQRTLAAAKLAAGNPASLPAGKLRDALMRAELDGVTAPQEIHQLTATAANNVFAGSRIANGLLRAWGAPFAIAESFNRRVAFIAAFQIAEAMPPGEFAKTGLKDSFEFAEDAVKQTQGIYNKGNRMNVGRGAVGSVLMTFKQYSIMYMELLKRLPPKQRAIMVGVLLIAAGGGGLPGVEDVEDLIDTIGQWLGFATNSRRTLRNTLTEWIGREGGDIVLNGLLSRLGIDLHSRMGMQNMIPGTGILKQSSVDKGRDIEEFFGPAASVVKSLGDALENLATGHPDRAVKALAPGAVRNAIQGAGMAATGYGEDAKGRRTVPVNELESFAKTVGFNPKSVADYGAVKRDIAQDQRLVGVKSEEFSSALANAILAGDSNARNEALKSLREWNESNPNARVTIQPAAIAKRVRDARAEGVDRMLRALPKGMRAQASEEMRQ